MGAEGFSSYEKLVGVKFIEKLGKWIAYALIIFGLLSLWVYYREKKDKEKQEVLTKKVFYRNNWKNRNDLLKLLSIIICIPFCTFYQVCFE
ncbi:hypothetical protein H9X96_21150 [Pedobacter sp. N36a]|nr:hypothetical protein [Pedobacter sp. N36a]